MHGKSKFSLHVCVKCLKYRHFPSCYLLKHDVLSSSSVSFIKEQQKYKLIFLCIQQQIFFIYVQVPGAEGGFCFEKYSNGETVQYINLQTPSLNYSRRTAPLTSKIPFYIFIQQIQLLNILNMVYTLRFFFSLKCSQFHNSNLFGSCIIHILFTECAKIKKIIPAPKS